MTASTSHILQIDSLSIGRIIELGGPIVSSPGCEVRKGRYKKSIHPFCVLKRRQSWAAMPSLSPCCKTAQRYNTRSLYNMESFLFVHTFSTSTFFSPTVSQLPAPSFLGNVFECLECDYTNGCLCGFPQQGV
jgi:hypothetical protein